MAGKPERRLTEGARKIRELMKAKGQGTSKFAHAAGVHRVTLHKIITGERWKHISVDFAMAMRDVSGGSIAIEDFASDTAVPVEDEDEDAGRRSTGTDG